MSGFFATLGAVDPRVIAQAAAGLAFSPLSRSYTCAGPPVAYAHVRFDEERLWSPARDPVSGTTVLIAGRIALDARQWDAALGMPYEGGAAAKHVLAGYLRHGHDFATELNGAFAVVVIGESRRELAVWTDRMGFIPVYAHEVSGRAGICTHADVLARALPTPAELDLTTMAEMLSHWNGVHAHTFHRGIRQLDAGSCYTWRAEGTSNVRRYWQPEYRAAAHAGVDELGEELAAALRRSVALRSQPAIGPTGVFLSGGADSRAILYSTQDPTQATSFTFYDEENREFQTARALAARAGSRHVGLRRDPEHYGKGAREAVRILGGTWNICDAHYTEFLPELRRHGINSWLSGCFADYLFKGIAQDRTYETLMGRAVPFFKPAGFSHQWYFAHGRIADKWVAPVEERCSSAYDGCDLSSMSDESRWNVEMRRLWPISREATIGSRLLLTRTLPWDVVLGDTAVLDVLMRIPARLKLNSEVWNAAVARICSSASDVKNSNWDVTIGASKAVNMAEFLAGVAKRKMRKLVGAESSGAPALATTGSWPDFGYYMTHSRVLRETWDETPTAQREIVNDILGFDAWSLSLPEWAARDVPQWYRIATLRLWLDVR